MQLRVSIETNKFEWYLLNNCENIPEKIHSPMYCFLEILIGWGRKVEGGGGDEGQGGVKGYGNPGRRGSKQFF